MRGYEAVLFRTFFGNKMISLRNHLAPHASALPGCAMPRVVDFKRFFDFGFEQILLFAKTRAKTKSRFGFWGQLRTAPCQGGIVTRANLLRTPFYTVFSYCQKWHFRHNKNNGLQYYFGLVYSSSAIGFF